MMNIKIYFCLLILLSLSLSCKGKTTSASASEEKDYTTILQAKADTAEAYCKAHGMNTDICFLIDMSIHPGKNRLFAWDFKQKKILFSGLCCHGMGGGSTARKPEFSNEPGSNCTSVGKYKLGIRSYSKWGIHIHYKMHGLEKTNNNAYNRIVVFHSHSPMPDKEIHPLLLPLGWSLGCPVVSDNTMRKVDELLKDVDVESNPVLMWIFVSE